MPECWVVHASPVITLAKAGYLDLITALATDILLPEAAVAEVLDGPATDPARQASGIDEILLSSCRGLSTVPHEKHIVFSPLHTDK